MRYSARAFLSALPFWIVAALLLAHPAQAQTNKCGDICTETWNSAGSPYIITCDVHVVDPILSCTLTIEAGTEVRFQNGTQLVIEVDNGLAVQGTSGSPVIFTSDSGTPTPLDWSGILLHEGSGATIDYADIRYASTCIQANPTSSLSLADCTVRDCGNTGLLLRSTTASITGTTVSNTIYGLHAFSGGTIDISDSTFTDNYFGVHVGGDNNPAPGFTMHDSSIYGNYTWNMWAAAVADPHLTILDARHNWWGSIDTTTIRAGISDHADSEATSPIVDWCEFLDSLGGSPVTTYECPDLVVCGGTKTWNVTSRPYLLASEVYVCLTGRLEVGPGVEVRAARHNELNMLVDGGQVDVDASSGAQTVFTTDDPSPGPGYWNGIKVYRASGVSPSLVMRNASIEHAHYGVHAYDDAAVTLESVEISDSAQHGIYLYDDVTASLTDVNSKNNVMSGLDVQGNVTLSATDCDLSSNGLYGASVQSYSAGSGAFAINNSAIHGNWGGHDVWTTNASDPDETVLDFKSNWWGTDDTRTIASRIHGHVADTSAPIIDWCPYMLSAPPSGTPADVECPDLRICGDSVTWDVTSRPYLLVSDLYVCPSMVLQVPAYVEVRVVRTSNGIEILVDGWLLTGGGPEAHTIFRSDDTVPGNQDWQGITFQGSAMTSQFYYTKVQNARIGLMAKDSVHLELERSEITDGGSAGIYATDDSFIWMLGVLASRNEVGLSVNGNAVVHGSYCTFTDNLYYGVNVDGTASYDPELRLAGSSIHSNSGSHDLYAAQVASPDTNIIWVSDCWWGTEDEAQIANRIHDRDDNGTSPRAYFNPFGPDCDHALGRDSDGDGVGDFEDNCPIDFNIDQTDADADGVGDPCDPDPAAVPTGPCDGSIDYSEGWADADGDGFGDSCDFQPTRSDSHYDATEICDSRDNTGGIHVHFTGEYTDIDLDGNIDCADCDTGDPTVNTCACENCTNLFDDDCDTLMDGDDPSCETSDICIQFNGDEPIIDVYKGACGTPVPTTGYDVIRGEFDQIAFASGSVDLGRVECTESLLADRHTDTSADPDLACMGTPLVFYLVKESSDLDFGTASSSEPRDTWECIP
jgi:hypothetical protein